jgi:hypothetical protein
MDLLLIEIWLIGVNRVYFRNFLVVFLVEEREFLFRGLFFIGEEL